MIIVVDFVIGYPEMRVWNIECFTKIENNVSVINSIQCKETSENLDFLAFNTYHIVALTSWWCWQ